MSLEKRIEEIIEDYAKKEYFNSVDVSFKYHNEIIVSTCYSDNRFTNDIKLYDLASLTKVITTTGILRLISLGYFSLDSRLHSILKLPKELEAISDITIEQLLTHSSGLISWYPFYSKRPNNLYDILSSIKLMHAEQSKVVYSDLNFILLGEVIQYQTGLTLQAFTQQYIVEPLELPTLTYGPIHNQGQVVPTEYGNRMEQKMCKDRNILFDNWRPYDQEILGEVNDGNAYYFFNGQSGHAGLFGTIADLEKIMDLYLKGGVSKNEKFIETCLVDKSLTPIIENRGLGWHTGRPFPSGMGHTGFTGTSMWIDKGKGISGSMLTNRLNVSQPKNITDFREEIHQEILKLLKSL